ncbi:MAG: putative DNA binding domain-containing protein [Clostridiales bacterium]|jgi:ATP-dependent DNA helicase RecG|nr:putative DNA binding domain-containing protein [Clostridiales bacterium]
MRIIPLKETLTIEFKSDRKKLNDADLIESVVGLANAKGGKLYVGVEDDGEITGLHSDHSNPITLAAFIANKTVPPISVRADIVEDGKKVVVVDVPMSTAICSTSGGKVLRRRLKADGAPETVPLYPHEYNTRLSNLSLLDFSAQPILDATENDLDIVERGRLRNVIRQNRGEAALLELADEDLDRALQLVKLVGDKYIPTITGLLLIGKEESLKRHIPTAGLAFQALKNTDVKLNETVVKPLLATFEKASEYFTAYNSEQEIEAGLYRISVPDFDRRAFREGLVNAFSHRDYGVMRHVRIQIDNDGLFINSPGGFIEGVNINNLLTAEPRSRNSALSDALKRIGLAERTGRGIDRIFEGSLLYGKPLPTYAGSDATNVRLFLPRANPDKAFTKFVADAMKDGRDFLSVFSLMVLNCIRQSAKTDIKTLTEQTGLEEYRVRSAIDRLVEGGYVDAAINGKTTYTLNPKVSKTFGLSGARPQPTDKKAQVEAVLKFAEEKKIITRGDVMGFFNITAPQAYRILAALVENGKLVMSGNKKSAAYTFVG